MTDFFSFAHELADAAGEVLRAHFRQSLPVEIKADASPVTKADREAEAAMRRLIAARYPDHGILGEEEGEKAAGARFCWVLDPIDGTRAFIAGVPTFTTLIALAEYGIPQLGLIDQPVLRERWAAEKGAGATFNNHPAKTDAPASLSGATLATTSTDYFTMAQAASFAALRGKCANTFLGGDAYIYARLASGQIALAADAGMKPYDFCALVPVVEGAGGIITDWRGNALTLHSDGTVLAAASAQLHAQALSVLNSSAA